MIKSKPHTDAFYMKKYNKVVANVAKKFKITTTEAEKLITEKEIFKLGKVPNSFETFKAKWNQLSNETDDPKANIIRKVTTLTTDLIQGYAVSYKTAVAMKQWLHDNLPKDEAKKYTLEYVRKMESTYEIIKEHGNLVSKWYHETPNANPTLTIFGGSK